MNPITIPNISIPTIGIPTIGIPSVGFPSASGGGLAWPAGMKEHIKAIYDPAKQGMTNYDVIEAYVEDFTNWTLDNTGITSTPKKIVIPAGTELKYVIAFRGFNGFTAGFDIKYTGNAVITYRYNKEDGTVGIITIDKSGIYHLPASVITQKNFGFYCNPQTVTEEATIEQLPTSILKDLSDNGLDAYMYGFQGKLNSGIGIYKFDFLSDLRINSAYLPYTERQDDKICSLAGHPAGWLFQFTSLSDIPAFKVEVKGIVNDNFTYRWYDENGNRGVDIAINEDGIYELPMSYSVETNAEVGIVCNNLCQDNVCFTQIPDYPDQLCYSGKEYCISYNQPILEDYTVMADRTWFKNRNVFLAKGNISTEAKYAFIFERFKPDGVMAVQSFGAWNDVASTTDSCISYLTKNKYNGIDIKSGISADDDMLSIGGALNKGNIELTSVCCHGKIIVADRSFTEEEITWLKDNFFTIDIPTPAYDFDFSKLKSGENTFTDKYGNELSLHNFAWAGMSGKDGYYTDFNSWQFYPSLSTVEHSSEKLIIKKVKNTAQFCASNFVGKFTAEVSGIPEGVSFYYRYIDKTTGNAVSITLSNGINEVDCSNANGDVNMTSMFLIGADNKDINIVIRQIPAYPNALVFDGVDDYALLPSEASKLIKSVILDVVPLKFGAILYDQRKDVNNDDYQFAVYHGENTIAYSARNNGDTYIDGVLNTTLIPARLTGRHMQVAITNNNVIEIISSIHIGCSIDKSLYSPMALYRITGFTEVLTPDQVWKWYQKNQPKGGDK